MARELLPSAIMRMLKLFSVTIIAVAASQALTCPQAVRGLRSAYVISFGGDLCALADTTARIRESFSARGIDANKFVGLRAGRFINLPDWEKANAKGNFDPEMVYEPAPMTWDNWALAADQVDSQGAFNARSNLLPDFSLDAFRAINLLSLPPSEKQWGGKIRGYGDEVGDKALDRETALTEQQIAVLKNLEYRDYERNSIVTFTPTICLDEASPEVQKSFENRREGNPADLTRPGSWFESGGQRRHCGLFQYTPAMQVNGQLKAYFANVNGSIQKLRSGAGDVDPIFLSARVQRWLVSIHPFVAAGNGRTSRFAMDTLLESLGLPAPVLPKDMNTDILSSEAQWASSIGAGIDDAFAILEKCVNKSNSPLCKFTK